MANRKFGEVVGIDPLEAVSADPDEVRAKARSLVRDPDEFERVLDRIAADLEYENTDEVALKGDPPRVLRRYTAPVYNRGRAPIGRLWTFLDVSETKRYQAEREERLRQRTEEFEVTSQALQVMNDLCRMAQQNPGREALLAGIVEQTRMLAGNQCSALLLANEAGTELNGFGSPVGYGVQPVRILRRQDSAVANALSQPRIDPAAPMTLYPGHRGVLAQRLNVRLLGVAPLCRDGQAFGVFALGKQEPYGDVMRLDRYRALHLGALVDQIALTLETHRLQRELHSAVETLQATQRRLVEIEKLHTAGVVAASVAHDIRNILAAMELEIAFHPDQVSPALNAHLARFRALTHRLLAFSRPGVLDIRPVALPSVFERIVPLIAGQAELSGVRIAVDLSARCPQVQADSGQLERLFVNLCLNAIQAMSAQGGTLSIRHSAQRDRVHVFVEDSGPGMDADTLARAFDPFFTTRPNGCGLGLFSSRRIAEEHRGQLTARSTPGKGTCFRVTLPRTRHPDAGSD